MMMMMMMMMIMMKMKMNYFCGIADQRDHRQEASPSRLSDTPRWESILDHWNGSTVLPLHHCFFQYNHGLANVTEFYFQIRNFSCAFFNSIFPGQDFSENVQKFPEKTNDSLLLRKVTA